MINRGPPPVQQSPGQQQYQPINRAPVPQQAPIPQQRPPQLVRAPIPSQAYNPTSSQPVNPANYQPVQNRPPHPVPQQQQQQQQHYSHNLSDGQGIRVNQPNQQFRQIQPQQQQQQQPQPRPINPIYNSNIQKVPIHLEERNKMATETANPTQPSYLISNSDDVDDVIVRPIANVCKMNNHKSFINNHKLILHKITINIFSVINFN